MKFYLIGIKGTGMVSLATVLKDLGYSVSGSDVIDNYFTDNYLINKGIDFYVFDESNIKDSDTIYIASSCYDNSNCEVKKVNDNKYSFYYYHEFIEKFFKGIKIGVSGSHGKTTTTSFINDLFKFDKHCAIIGDGFGYGMIDYDYLIFESCEYKDHILSYTYDYLIINNIDMEHLDFFKDYNSIMDTFIWASKRAKVLITHESVDINHECKYTFGTDCNNFCYYEILESTPAGYKLKIIIDNNIKIIYFPFVGKHMINNLMAAIVVYYLCHNNLDNLETLIINFRKPKRRMEQFLFKDNVIIDDYAHHPTEIEALIEAVKQKYDNKKIIVIFQPHTYSRTFTLEDRFKECFKGVEELFIADTFTSKREMYSLENEKRVLSIFNGCKRFTKDVLKDLKEVNNSVIIFLGAGIINKYIVDLM